MMNRRRVLILFLVLCVFGIMNGSLKKKPHFSLSSIRSSFPSDTKWATNPLSDYEREELKTLLSQDFNYLGSGAEVFAFVSADGNTVIKFFRMKHLIPKTWLNWVPLPGLDQYRFNKITKRIARHEQLFTSYKMAYDDLKEESGLLYIHLNKSKDLKLKINLYDRMRKRYILPLDDYEFVIQRRGQLIYDRIAFFMQKGREDLAVEALHTFLRHVSDQCAKGYVDQDSGLSQNYGFVGEQVIHFDVGRIVYDEKMKEPPYAQHELLRVERKLATWLQDHYPSLIPCLEEACASLLLE